MKIFLSFVLLLTSITAAWADSQDVLEALNAVSRAVRNNVSSLSLQEQNRIVRLLEQVRSIAIGAPRDPAGNRKQYYLKMSDAELYTTAMQGIGLCSITDARSNPNAHSYYYVRYARQGFAFTDDLTEYGGADYVGSVAVALRQLIQDGVCTDEAVSYQAMSRAGIIALASSGELGRCGIKDQRQNSAARSKFYVTLKGVGARYDDSLTDYGGTDYIDTAAYVVKKLALQGACF